MHEDEAERPSGVTDTMFTATDFLEDDETQNILNIAPGEWTRPLSVFYGQILRRVSISWNISWTTTN